MLRRRPKLSTPTPSASGAASVPHTWQPTPAQFDSGLESWGWLRLKRQTPFLASTFGHVFLRGRDGISWLDPIGGEAISAWDTEAEMAAALATETGQDEWLLAGLAIGAERLGSVLGPGQIYTFVPPPALGGPFDPANVMVIDFEVGLNIAGQLHEQIKDLPPGTQISGISFNEDS